MLGVGVELDGVVELGGVTGFLTFSTVNVWSWSFKSSCFAFGSSVLGFFPSSNKLELYYKSRHKYVCFNLSPNTLIFSLNLKVQICSIKNNAKTSKTARIIEIINESKNTIIIFNKESSFFISNPF